MSITQMLGIIICETRPKKVLTSGNVLVADGRLTVDAALEAGQVNETVTAEAGETVNTTSGGLFRRATRAAFSSR